MGMAVLRRGGRSGWTGGGGSLSFAANWMLTAVSKIGRLGPSFGETRQQLGRKDAADAVPPWNAGHCRARSPGCKNQSTPLTQSVSHGGPRAAAVDARARAGTAQPYYPGDPAPAVRAVAPGPGVTAAVGDGCHGACRRRCILGAGADPGGSSVVTAADRIRTTDAAGRVGRLWAAASLSSKGPRRRRRNRGDSINVPADQQQLRFESATPRSSGGQRRRFTPSASAPTLRRLMRLAAPTRTRLPIQSDGRGGGAECGRLGPGDPDGCARRGDAGGVHGA